MTSPVSRRTAAHTAWLTPVVVAAAGVPAFAASGPAALSVTMLSATRSGQVMTVNFVIANANTQPSVALRVALDVVPLTPGVTSFATATGSSTSTNFKAPVATSPAVVDRSFDFEATRQVPGNGTLAFAAVIDLSTAAAGTLSITGTTTGGAFVPSTGNRF